jgi:hypothetical protein
VAVETGDIMIFSEKFGHVALVYDAKRAVHGQYFGNFHLEDLQTEKANGHIEQFSGNSVTYKFPWHRYGEAEKAGYQARIQNAANVIMQSSKYGLYRGLRLQLGSSNYGKSARGRLNKYRERMARGGDKMVTTITCAEAAILSLQLTFLENGGPGFIKLDGAHTMPATLEKWLKANWN